MFCIMYGLPREPDKLGFSSIELKSHGGTPGLDFSKTGSNFGFSVADVFGGKVYVELCVVSIEVNQNTVKRSNVNYVGCVKYEK